MNFIFHNPLVTNDSILWVCLQAVGFSAFLIMDNHFKQVVRRVEQAVWFLCVGGRAGGLGFGSLGANTA